MVRNTLKKLKDFFNEFGHGPEYPHPEVQRALERKGYRFEEEFTPFPRSTPNFTTFIYRGRDTLVTSDEGMYQTYLKHYHQALDEYRARRAAADNPQNFGGPKPPEPK